MIVYSSLGIWQNFWIGYIVQNNLTYFKLSFSEQILGFLKMENIRYLSLQSTFFKVISLLWAFIVEVVYYEETKVRWLCIIKRQMMKGGTKCIHQQTMQKWKKVNRGDMEHWMKKMSMASQSKPDKHALWLSQSSAPPLMHSEPLISPPPFILVKWN